MTDDDRNEAFLTGCFEASRAQAPRPSEALLQRIMEDARAVQPVATTPARVSQPARQGRLWSILREIGGWPALAGLSAAVVAGVWIGVAAPTGLTAQTSALWGGDETQDTAYLLDMAPDTIFAFAEETQ